MHFSLGFLVYAKVFDIIYSMVIDLIDALFIDPIYARFLECIHAFFSQIKSFRIVVNDFLLSSIHFYNKQKFFTVFVFTISFILLNRIFTLFEFQIFLSY